MPPRAILCCLKIKSFVFTATACLFSLKLGYDTAITDMHVKQSEILEQTLKRTFAKVVETKRHGRYKSNNAHNYTHYVPAPVEEYVVKNAKALGYSARHGPRPRGCTIFNEKNATPIYEDLHTYLRELNEYNERLSNFSGVADLRMHLDEDKDICNIVELHPEGLPGIFQSRQLSYSASGFVEPLLPPLRHPKLCFNRYKHIMDLSWLVHDFGAMCRKLKKRSRTVLIDMGASLETHDKNAPLSGQPSFYLIDLYEKFGFPFDHIYAYEIAPQAPQKVFEMVPDKLRAAYHWINVGVDPTPGDSMNPLTMLLDRFNPEDLVIVKLDVDNPSVELPLAQQLLNDHRFATLVDQFYFEYHVNLKEMAFAWGTTMKGSVKDSLVLFSALRQKGIPAHYWP